MHIRRGDTVIATAGKDKGKTGKVLKIFPKENRLIVEGINYIKKHTRKTREEQTGGIIQKEGPIDISNLMLFCKKCNRPTRVGKTVLKDDRKERICKKCGETI
jgi:large subunit ribosomal protein L24